MFKIIGNGSFGKALRSYINFAADNDKCVSETNYEWIILAVPSYAVTQVELENDKKYLLVSKGMVKRNDDQPLLITEWAEIMGLNYAYLAGPHLAHEIENHLPSTSTIATSNQDYFYQLEQYFPSPIYSSNMHLMSLAGVVKNIIAYSCGMYSALQLGENFNASLIMSGIKELVNVARHMNLSCQLEEVISPAVMADLILTGGSKKSRNFISGYNHIKGSQSEHLTEAHHSSMELIKRIGYAQKKWPLISLVASMIDGNLCSTGDLMEAWKDIAEGI